MDSKQKEQQQWHELYEKWSWVASQFFDEAVKDFNEAKDSNNKRAYFCLPPKIEEHLRRVWRAILADEFSSIKFSKLIEKIENGKSFTKPMEIELITALREEVSQFSEGSFSPTRMIKDSDNKDELKRNWYDFFYWGHDKRLAASLGKVSKVLARKEVKKLLDVLLWQGWKRKEVEEIYLEKTKDFGNGLRWLRYDILGEGDLPVDAIYGDDDFSGEKRRVKLYVESWFDEALEEFMKGKPYWILSISPTAGKDLKDILNDLWKVNFEICLLKKEFKQLGAEVTENERGISPSFTVGAAGDFYNQKTEKHRFLWEYPKREKEIKKELRREGRAYHFFWMRRFSSFWKKSYSDELATTISNYFKEKIRNSEKFHLYWISKRVSEWKLEVGEVAAEKQKKAEMEEIKRNLVPYEEVLARFEENWKKVQEMTRHDLGGWSYYLEKVVKVAVPILVLLTFLFGGGQCNGNQARGDQNSGAHQIDKTANAPRVFL